jgi:hypothetical protein
MNLRPSGLLIALTLVCLLAPEGVSAAVLSWTTTGTNSTWTAGTPSAAIPKSQVFSTTDPNVYAIVTISQNGTGTWYDGSSVVTGSAPQISTALDAGGTNRTLMVGLLKQSSATAYIQVSVSFVLASNTNTKIAVNNVSTTLFDVDRSTATNIFTDQVAKILGTTAASGTVGVSSITPGTDNTVTGSGTGTVVTGIGSIGGGGANNDNSSTGNVSFSYGSQAITGFSFQYSNPAWTSGGGNQIQFIALGDINFTEISTPEMNPGVAAALTCVGVAAFRRYRPRRT